MTTFQEGPANGVILGIRRAPKYLRVVRDEEGKWDALDQLDDTCRLGETVFVYRLIRNDGICCVRMSKGRGGCFPMATYRFIEAQPEQATLKTTSLWRLWCEAAIEAESQPKESEDAKP